MNIDIKCKDCESPVKPTGIIITDKNNIVKNIDFSQAKGMECTKCGCKWLSVRVTDGVLSMNNSNGYCTALA